MSPSKQPANGTRKATRAATSGRVAGSNKVAVDADGKRLTQEQLRRFADDAVDELNLRIEKAGTELNGAADFAFKRCFGSDVEAALTLDRNQTPLQYDLLIERAGKSLKLRPDEFRSYVRIGAMNQLSRASAWKKLDYSVKEELLPLVNVVDANGRRDLASFHRGVGYANQPNVGVLAVREWVQNELPRKDGSVGRPRGMTYRKVQSFLEVGVKLGTLAQRASAVRSVQKAPAPTQTAVRKDLARTIANLIAFRDELESGNDD